MKKSNRKKIKRIGFYATVAAFAVFAGLKLTGAVAWPWWWVTAPIWIPFLIAVIAVIVFMVLRKYYGI